MDTVECIQYHKITAGVSQDSVMGPDCDERFEISLPELGHPTAFADDVAVTVVRDSIEEADVLVVFTINRIATFHSISEMVVTRRKCFPQPYSIIVNSLTLAASKRSVQYLEVQSDAKLTSGKSACKSLCLASQELFSRSSLFNSLIWNRNMGAYPEAENLLEKGGSSSMAKSP